MPRPYDRIRRATALSARAFALVGVAVSGLAFLALVAPSPTVGQSGSRDEVYRQLTLFGDVFQRVREEYVEEVGEDKLVSDAINGMLTSLDPHSNYLDEEAFENMRERTKGEFGGLGIEITMENGLVKVVSPIDGTPAARAGIQSGDVIVGIGDEDVLGLTLSEAVELMRGPVGTDIEITVRRAGVEDFAVTITRDTIKMTAIRTDSHGEAGYIRITTFSEQTTKDLHEAIATLRDTHGNALIGIVLDLRNNPGGLLNEAIKVADTFLERGEIVSTRGRSEDDTTRHYAEAGDRLGGLPIVVLINDGSASASEIVAGALKDHGRALVMGTRSFGKGSVQSIIPLPGHGAIRLTTARYYTPSGVSIQATGIEPDIVVEPADVEVIQRGAVREEDLRGALDSDGGGGPGGGDAEGIEDYQVARAVDALRAYDVFRNVLK